MLSLVTMLIRWEVIIVISLPCIVRCGVGFKVYESVHIYRVVITAAFCHIYMLQFDGLLQKMIVICQFKFLWFVTVHVKMSHLTVTCWLLVDSKKKVTADIALHGNPISVLRDITCHMESHSVTCYPTQVNAPRLTPAMQAGTRFTYPGGMEGWVDLVDLIAPGRESNQRPSDHESDAEPLHHHEWLSVLLLLT